MSPRGYCQGCGREFAVFGDGTRIARHGFSRHHGRECPGSRKPPGNPRPFDQALADARAVMAQAQTWRLPQEEWRHALAALIAAVEAERQ